jgi:hypothetical protein
VGECGGEGGYGLVETCAECEAEEGWRECWTQVVELVAECEVAERGRERGDRVIELVAKS